MINGWRMRWVGNVGHMEEIGNSYKALTGKPKGRSLESPRHRWENNIVTCPLKARII
jgi:hypothetical protein